jgi:PAS domain S-box-containing protein
VIQLGEGSAFALAALVAALAAVALYGLFATVRLRRAASRLGTGIAEVRRHPLVGGLPREDESALRPAVLELEGLVEALREQVVRAQERATSLQSLADGPSDVALIGLDAEWQVVALGRGAATMTGWDPEEVAGQHVEALFAPGEWERILPKLSRRSVREEGFAETVRLQRRDGTPLACRLSVCPAGPASGVAGGTLLAARDLSQELELERRLRVSEERHRRLVEEIQDGVCILDGGRIAFANAAFARLMGLEPEAVKGQAFKGLLDTRDLLRVLDLIARAERGDAGPGVTVCRLAAPGRASVEARLTWSATEFQGRTAVFCTVADLTERARYERSIAESEARLRSALEATGDAMLVFADAGRGPHVMLANRAFGALFGIEEGALSGAPLETIRRLVAERGIDASILDDLLQAAGGGGEARRAGVEVATPLRRVVDLFAGPVRSRSGEGAGIILTARDVTTRVDSERALQQSLDDLTGAKRQIEASFGELGQARTALQERNAQLERLNTELRSLDEMKSNLLANVSHELHTPLVSIKGYTEMILKRKLGPLTPEQERGLGVALKNIERLIELIDNLLSFARMETGETQLTLEDVPLWQLVDEAVDLVGERIKRRNLSVTTQYDSDDLVVRGDRVKLGQVFTNLLTNAVKFNREGGSIAIAARRGRGGFVEVEVADTGIGIPSEEQERIFERFYQVDSGSRRRYEGTGIGLSIVRDILRLHGCSIRVSSTPGEGSTFFLTLPLGRRGAPSDARPQAGRGRARD